MKRKYFKPIFFIGCLIAVTGAAMAYSGRVSAWIPNLVNSPDKPHHNGIVTVAGHLVQDKIYQGGDGSVGFSLTLRADDVLGPNTENLRNVDMVIVLDRSGSMQGKKIQDAKRAVSKLLSSLSEKDRIALVSYSNGVTKHSGLVNATGTNRNLLMSSIDRIFAGGGTNLGAGLQTGINTLIGANAVGNAGKVILISDGLANQGITDPSSLGNMASVAVKKEFSVTTVGVGNDFNEHLMTHIADQGTGNYYYLENPDAFADVFQKEFYLSSVTAATGVEIHIPLKDGLSVVDASGYPIKIIRDHAVLYPGDLRSGQTRKLFLTFKVPTHAQATYPIEGIAVHYMHNEAPFVASLSKSFQIACVEDEREALSSIKKNEWEQKVIQDDYNKLREDVSKDIKEGKQEKALERIHTYHTSKQQLNAIVGSAKVAENLDKDLDELRSFVNDTFQGEPAAVMQKQKAHSKALQYEGYKGRRTK